MKKCLLKIGIVIAILAISFGIFLYKIQPTASDEELRDMIAYADEMDMNEQDEAIDLPNNQPVGVIVCNHTYTDEKIVNATCTQEGSIISICKNCQEIVNKEVQEMIPHTFITKQIEPTCTQSGKVYDICTVCGYETNQQSLEKTNHKTKTVVITERSCYSDGMTHVVCEKCDTIVNKQWSAQYNHQWIYVSEIFPTPAKDGSITYRCYHCNTQKTEVEKFKQKGSVNLCIPSQEINVEVFLGECNQTNTDKYDVSCDMNFIDNNNPLFFGHSTGTLRYLSNLQVGDYIYFTINGKTTTYKVTVSEESYLINGGADIQGKETGETILSKKDKNTLHFFTCYSTPFNPNGRWIVLAEKV